jgi:hypothetical protein
MDRKLMELIGLDPAGSSTSTKDATSAVMRTKVVKSPIKEYGGRHREYFYKPEYDFADIERAQDADSYIAQSIKKKSQKFLLAGYEFIGENQKTVEYIVKRIAQLEIAQQKPFPILLLQTVADVERFQNALWVIKRDAENSGGKPYRINGTEIDPIAGIFIPPFASLQWKHNKSGKLTKIKQVIEGVEKPPEWKAEDCIHFYMNRRPGYTVGSPTLFPAIDDVKLLRKIEENVEDLISSNLFPLYHYQIGNEKYPAARNIGSGLSEEEQVAAQLEYMPASGVYISDYRHKIEVLGSEGKALRIDYYLTYFKNRVFSALGMSATDFGESDSNNKSTAGVQSKALTESVESMQQLMKCFIDTYLIRPLLLESDFKFDVMAPENIVEIQFGKIDINEQSVKHNEINQLYQSNMLTHEEARKMIGKRPIKNEESLNYNKFPNRGELAREAAAKAGAAGSNNTSNQHGSSRRKSSKDEALDKIRSVRSLSELHDLLKEELIIRRLVAATSHQWSHISDILDKVENDLDNLLEPIAIYREHEIELPIEDTIFLLEDAILDLMQLQEEN